LSFLQLITLAGLTALSRGRLTQPCNARDCRFPLRSA